MYIFPKCCSFLLAGSVVFSQQNWNVIRYWNLISECWSEWPCQLANSPCYQCISYSMSMPAQECGSLSIKIDSFFSKERRQVQSTTNMDFACPLRHEIALKLWMETFFFLFASLGSRMKLQHCFILQQILTCLYLTNQFTGTCFPHACFLTV